LNELPREGSSIETSHQYPGAEKNKRKPWLGKKVICETSTEAIVYCSKSGIIAKIGKLKSLLRESGEEIK